jgi:hypothetical protein
VRDYRLEIETSQSGVWEVYPHCDDTITFHSCRMTSGLLTGEPFNLELQAPVKARISARNDSGWGEPSEVDSDCKTVIPAVPLCAGFISVDVVPGSCLVTYGRPDCIRGIPTEPILGYELQVRDLYGEEYHAVPHCRWYSNEDEQFDNPDSKCTIDRNLLFEYPWKLQEGDVVHAQAVAFNRYGKSLGTQALANPKVKMGRPTDVVNKPYLVESGY